ncbi:MAG: hypothetical protein KGL92_10615 [Gammaproteobacteria bacterium]|nr:hypothetical protein [Gammaproteobacteria bacterium]
MTEIWKRSGALVGLYHGERFTIPPRRDVSRRQTLQTVRAAMLPNPSTDRSAVRYLAHV